MMRRVGIFLGGFAWGFSATYLAWSGSEWFFTLLSVTACVIVVTLIVRQRQEFRDFKKAVAYDEEVLAMMGLLAEHIATEIRDHGTVHVNMVAKERTDN